MRVEKFFNKNYNLEKKITIEPMSQILIDRFEFSTPMVHQQLGM